MTGKRLAAQQAVFRALVEEKRVYVVTRAGAQLWQLPTEHRDDDLREQPASADRGLVREDDEERRGDGEGDRQQ